jgi:magnesium-transporting ATPase (P-type)
MLAGVLAIGSFIVALLSRYIKNFSLYKKKALLYLVCMTLLFAVISSIPFLFTHQHLMNQYFFYEVWFLGLGVVHCHFMYTRFWANETTLVSELAFILAIWLFGGAGFVLVNRFLDKDTFLYYPMLTSMFSFVLPTFVYKTFEKMMAIPVKVHKWWQYPMYKDMPEVNEEEMKDLIVIGLEMEKGHLENSTYVSPPPKNKSTGTCYICLKTKKTNTTTGILIHLLILWITRDSLMDGYFI